ncbi:MAG: hypothetical protein FWG80_04970, partial [Alphaproteobacteria bacterium]|nr:hypothetical protein [Alphaproteobacteria bacterium]
MTYRNDTECLERLLRPSPQAVTRLFRVIASHKVAKQSFPKRGSVIIPLSEKIASSVTACGAATISCHCESRRQADEAIFSGNGIIILPLLEKIASSVTASGAATRNDIISQFRSLYMTKYKLTFVMVYGI